MGEVVKHPDHYCKGRKYEPKDVIYDWGLDFNLGSAVKYLSRAGRKEYNSKEQDLQKAIQYIEFELEEIGKKEKEGMAKIEDEPHWMKPFRISLLDGDGAWVFRCSKCGHVTLRLERIGPSDPPSTCPHCQTKMKAWRK